MRSPYQDDSVLHHYVDVLRGAVDGRFISEIVEKIKWRSKTSLIASSRYQKMKLSDYIITLTCKRVRNNKLNIKLYKNKIVKYYEDTDKYLFVWEG